MRTLCGLMLGGLVAILLCGCDPALLEEDLGTAVFEVPEIPEARQPYELPHSPPLPRPRLRRPPQIPTPTWRNPHKGGVLAFPSSF